jgi:Protein of unknown function (DUF4238)
MRSDFDAWGDVPADPDLTPFSKLNVGVGVGTRKRHHFLSVTYMEGFTQSDRLWVYRSDAPECPHPTRPIETGFENYYHSIVSEDGVRDNHSLEDLWGRVESVWPATRRALHAGRVSPAVSFNTLGLAMLQRVRVPAARDRRALLLGAKLRAEVQALEGLGRLPADLQRYASQLDTVPVGINPDLTLSAIRDDMKDFGELCFQLGFIVLHNKTDLPFITSDNPVCIFDPALKLEDRRPYQSDGSTALVFPIDSHRLLYGHSGVRPPNEIHGHRTIHDRWQVEEVNRIVARFAYRFALAGDRTSDAAIAEQSHVSPTANYGVRTVGKTIEVEWENVFGPRPKLSPFINTPAKAARLEAEMAHVALATGETIG